MLQLIVSFRGPCVERNINAQHQFEPMAINNSCIPIIHWQQSQSQEAKEVTSPKLGLLTFHKHHSSPGVPGNIFNFSLITVLSLRIDLLSVGPVEFLELYLIKRANNRDEDRVSGKLG